MHGRHTLKTWSSTQPSVTLSSGEAEFYGVVRASGAALGHKSLMEDLGSTVNVRVWTDSTAAMGIGARSGLGKLRHLETHCLWVQEKIRAKAFELRKVRGEVNPADLFTKHLSSRDRVLGLTKLFGCDFRNGRSETAPLLRPRESVPVHLEDPDHDIELDYFDLDLPEAAIHDDDMLPHDYTLEDQDQMFPKIEVGEPEINIEDWNPEEDEEGATSTGTSSTTTVPIVSQGNMKRRRPGARGLGAQDISHGGWTHDAG